MTTKTAVAKKLLPAARWYVYHFPLTIGKLLLLRKFRGRDIDVVSKTKGGFRLNLNVKDLIQGYIYFFGVWEPNLTEFITSRLKKDPGRTFVDVGANIGYFSMLAAGFLTSGRVVAIEPFPDIYNKLVANVALNNPRNIRLVNKAVTNEPCTIKMHYGGDSNCGKTSVQWLNSDIAPADVEGDSLLEILSRAEVSTARILKIDVEGHEYEVLAGMFGRLGDFPDDLEIACEITPKTLGPERVREIFEKFRAAGFHAYGLENEYSVRAYLSPRFQREILRLESYPKLQADVIFSKKDEKFLHLIARD